MCVSIVPSRTLLRPTLREQLFEEEGRCRFAVGPGDGTELQLALGMAEDCSAHLGECAAAVLDESDWQAGLIALKLIEDLRRVRDNGCSALLERGVDETVAIG